MATVAHIFHYAQYGDDYGVAEFVNGSGYLFRKEGERKAILVSYTDVELMLFGRVDLACAQWALDESQGGLVRTCSRTLAA